MNAGARQAQFVGVDRKSSLPAAVLAMVLDRTTDGTLMADRDGVIVYANEPLLRLFGYSLDDVVGESIELLIPEDARDDHRSHIDGFVDSPSPRPMGRPDLDIEGRRADGSVFPVDVQLSPLPGGSLIAATVRDMTHERQAAVDSAILKLDLAGARAQIDRLQRSLDLVIQSLFGLGTSITASATNDTVLAERLAATVHGIDQIIAAVQDGRRAPSA